MARKRWRVVFVGATDLHEFPSEMSAYDHVDALHNDWLDGAAIGSLTVQIDEGFGWQPYEHINFADEA